MIRETPNDDGAVAEALTAGHRALCAAMVDADTAALDVLLAEGYTLTHMNGYVQSRSEWLEEVDRGSMSYHSMKDVDVEVDADGSVLTARTLTDATIWGSRNTWRLQLRTHYLPDGADEWIASRTVASTW